MKRYRFLAALLILCAVLATGCSSGKSPDIEPSEAAATIFEQTTLKDELLLATPENIGNYYKGLKDVSDDYAVYISGTGVTCEEIAVVRAKSGKSADDVKAELERRIEDQKIRYENYQPVEMVKLGDPVIEAKGDTVIMILCDDTNSAAGLARELLGIK